MISPFIKELNHYTHTSVSLVIFGLFSLMNAVLVLYLPETKGLDIPDTIEQVEDRGCGCDQKITPKDKPNTNDTDNNRNQISSS